MIYAVVKVSFPHSHVNERALMKSAVSGYTRCVKRLDQAESKSRPILSDQLDKTVHQLHQL